MLSLLSLLSLRKSWFGFVSVLLFSTQALAYTKAEEKILEKLGNLDYRPTISDVVKAFKGRVPKVEVDAGTIEDLAENLPKTMAHLEKYFPGGIYSPLGRSALDAGDALDAAFAAMGQLDRVRHTRVSSESFQNATDKEIVAFLDTLGVPLNPKTIKKARPFVLFDHTSYSSSGARTGNKGSQSYVLMSRGYEAFKKRGGKGSDLLKKFAMMDMAGGMDDVLAYWKEEDKHLKENPGEPPSRTLDLGIGNISSGTGDYWHHEFGPFYKTKKGGTITDPGEDAGQRPQILEEMIKLYNAAKNPKVLRAIQKAFKELKIASPMDGAAYKKQMAEFEKSEKEAEARQLEELKEEGKNLPQTLSQSLSELVKKSKKWVEPKVEKDAEKPKLGYLTENAKPFRDWLNESVQGLARFEPINPEILVAGRNMVVEIFVQGVTEAMEAGKIRSTDFRRLLALGISQAALDKDTVHGNRLIKSIATLIEKSETFKDTLYGKEEFFMTAFENSKKEVAEGKRKTPREGMENTAANYKRMMGLLRPVRK